jgi:GNAT superfamily N-acetyltransferase
MQVGQAASPETWTEVERLIRAYLAELPFEIDFQDLDRELAALHTEYGPPDGAALLALDDDERAVGIVGVRRFDDRDGELKRMYVDPSARGTGVGHTLGEGSVAVARSLGYERLLLDTVDTMTAAIATYEALGFVEIAPYRHNPLPGARYFALSLR